MNCLCEFLVINKNCNVSNNLSHGVNNLATPHPRQVICILRYVWILIVSSVSRVVSLKRPIPFSVKRSAKGKIDNHFRLVSIAAGECKFKQTLLIHRHLQNTSVGCLRTEGGAKIVDKNNSCQQQFPFSLRFHREWYI